MEPLHDPDHALVVACQQGHLPSRDASFRVLHDRHKDLVHRICLRITGDAHEALDAAQDAFLLAFHGIRGLRFGACFPRWLCRIAARASFERLRRRRPPSSFSELERPEFECERRVDPRFHAERREHDARVRHALRRLPPHLSQILVLRYFEGLSYEELASRLSIPIGSVRSRLHRASASFREIRSLEGELGEP
jgi:RNA polymerase sigma-70 factor (ECF subfamily)